MHTHSSKSQSTDSKPAAPRPEAAPLENDDVLQRPAAAHDSKLQPAHILRLQRQIGNRAVQRLLNPIAKTRPAGMIQRLLAVGSTYDESIGDLYVPKEWMDTKFDDRTETIRQVNFESKHAGLKPELLENINTTLGTPDIQGLQEVEPASKQKLWSVFDAKGQTTKLTSAKLNTLSPTEKTRLQTLTEQLAGTIADKTTTTILAAPLPSTAQDISALPKKLMLTPNHLVKAPSDIRGFDITKVCALIAIVKSEEGSRTELNTKLSLTRNLTSDAAYYEAMYGHYYTTGGVEYDEPSTHPKMYSEWGFNLIFSGDSAYHDLPTVLKQPLVTGKKYIFDITDHSVYVKMKKNLPTGTAIASTEKLSDYFTFHSDNQNFNPGKEILGGRKVQYIYEK